MRFRLAAPAVALVCAAVGCGGGDVSPAEPAPIEPALSGALVALAPAGAELAVEVDVARIRDSEGLGAHVEALRGEAATVRGGIDLLAADELLLASYHIGRDAAQTLTFVRGDRVAAEVAAMGGAEMLREDTAVLGPPELVALARERAGGAGDSLASEARLMELREAAVPPRAPGAALRVSAELGFDARVGLSQLLSLPDVPVALSVWGDVIDDLAVVALLGAESAEEADALARAARSWRERAARTPPVLRLGLAEALRRAVVETEGATVRVTIVIPPAGLERVARALVGELTGARKEPR